MMPSAMNASRDPLGIIAATIRNTAPAHNTFTDSQRDRSRNVTRMAIGNRKALAKWF